jgi:hypothetical protein
MRRFRPIWLVAEWPMQQTAGCFPGYTARLKRFEQLFAGRRVQGGDPGVRGMLAWGAGQFPTARRGNAAAPLGTLKHALARHFTIIEVDEAYTSRCHYETARCCATCEVKSKAR